MKKLFSLFTVSCIAFSAMQARVTLPVHFTDNMVVQQQSVLHLKGTATGPTVTVKVSWQKSPVTAQVDAQGRWKADVPTPKASLKPQTLTFTDRDGDLTLQNVLVGEVWLGSGQSNMEMPVAGWGKVLNYEQEIEDARFPMIRLLQVKKVTNLQPQAEVQLNMGGWQECSPQYIPNFSALAYFYARRLWEELKVPIGIIDDDWGGTVAQAWTSSEALEQVQGFEQLIPQIRALNYDVDALEQWGEKRVDEVDGGTLRGWHLPDFDHSSWLSMDVPAPWETTPLDAFDGIVWFRRVVEIPQEWAGRDLTINLGGVDDQNITYWNGEAVGRTGSLAINTRYTIPGRLVKGGQNVIAIRILDTGGNGGLTSGKENLYVQLDDQHRLSLAGTWRMQASAQLKLIPMSPSPRNNANYPTVLYNAMIHPLIDFPIRGFIWYQGCSNVGADRQYESLFQTMIQDWRNRFGNPDMPFYFVQLANYLAPSDCQPDSRWALLREAQAHALCLNNTGMAVNIDLGDEKDIHPKTKRELGRRLAAIALHNTYGKKVPFTAPVYDSFNVVGREMHIRFALPEGSEPLVQEDRLPGFIIAGPDGHWHVATARTSGRDEVVVSCPEVTYPVAVRYGWADNPTCTLRTASGLHVAPFRTDKW